jgi:transcriptional regulator with XRE-family HTH domain
MNRNSNIIGRKIAKLRYERNWSQAILVAKLQLQGNETIRAVVANIETRRSSVTDKQLAALAKAFGISVAELFPA